jgi:excisionase family DNA binding protein
MFKPPSEAHSPDACPLLNLQQTAQRLGIGESTVRKLVRTGALPAVKLGRRLLFEPAALGHFIAAHRTNPCVEVSQ